MTSLEANRNSARPAANDGTVLAAGRDGHGRWAFMEIPRSMPLSLGLVAACATLDWLKSEWGPGDLHRATLFHMGADHGVSVLHGEVWRLVASIFLHNDGNHLVNNLTALLLFGGLIEATLGSRRFILLFAAAGLVGAVAQDVVTPTAMSCGASGAIVGLMTAALRIDTSRVRESWGLPRFAAATTLIAPVAQRIFKALALIVFGIRLNVGPHVAVAAHLAGGCTGLLLAPALQRWERRRAERAGDASPGQRSWLTVAAWCATLIMTASIIVAISRGRAWQLRDPPIERVPLGSTQLWIELPVMAARDSAEERAGTFIFGSYPRSPMRWLVTIHEWTLPAEERAPFLVSVLEAEDRNPDWVRDAPAATVRLGNRDMIRFVERSRGTSLEQATYQMFAGPYWIRLTAWRDGPSVWPGLDERAAASVGMYGTNSGTLDGTSD